MDEQTLDAIHDLWRQGAPRDVDEIWSAILAMTDDPIAVADRIAEAGQKDPSLAAPVNLLEQINAVAVDGVDAASVDALPRSLTFSAALAAFRSSPTPALARGLAAYLQSNRQDVYRLSQDDIAAINRLATPTE